jgi:hypothetical protein
MSTRTRRLISCAIILAIAGAHFVVSFIALLFSFGAGMSGFDSPTPVPPSSGDRVLSIVTTILHSPLVTLCPFPVPGLLGYILFAMNSLLWATCIYWLGRYFIRRLLRAYETRTA